MATTRKQSASKQADTTTTTTKDRVQAASQFDTVLAAIKAAGKDGVTLKALGETTGLRYRVLHNITWRLEGSPEVRDKEKYGQLRKPDEAKIVRVGKGRAVRYAAK